MGLFSKLFGGKSESKETKESMTHVEGLVEGILERSGLEISFQVTSKKEDDREVIHVNFTGDDEKLFTGKDGALLDAFQLLLKRAMQHAQPDEETHLVCDCDGFRAKANQSLVELAEKLKNRAIDQGKSVYLRALPPKDRKVIHQFLASDDRVKSRSVGDGLYKKIKIYPNKKEASQPTQ